MVLYIALRAGECLYCPEIGSSRPGPRPRPRPHQITSHHITSHQIRSDQITSHHITSHHITSQHGPGAKRQKMARNGSGMDENQHNLVKMARNFDASPAVTTGMPQDPYLGSKREVSGSIRPGRRHGAPAL